MAPKTYLFLFILFLLPGIAIAQNPADDLLREAIRHNNLDSVKIMVEKGGNVNAADSNHASMLMWACYKAGLPVMKYLVSKGVDPRKKGWIYINDNKESYYGNLTGIAAGEGKLDILKFLVEELNIKADDKELDNTTQTETGWNALHWASSRGHLEIVKYLVEKGADINSPYSDTSTPLLYALQGKHPDVAQFLINSGADVNKKYTGNGTALMYAVLANDFENCVLLWQHHANLNDKADNGVTALSLAMQKGPSRIVDFLKNPTAYGVIAKRNYWPEMKERFTRYNELKETDKAIPFGIRAIEGARQEKTDTTKEYYLFLQEYATANARNKSYDSADIYFNKARAGLKQYGRGETAYYSLLYLMQYYYETITKQMEKAADTYIELIDVARQLAGEKDEAYVKKINEAALFYETWNKPPQAIQYYSQAGGIYKDAYGLNSKQYAGQLNKLAKYYEKLERYDTALNLYNQVKDIYKGSAESSTEYFSAVNDLAKLYRKLKSYSLALPLLKITAAHNKELKGDSSDAYALSLNQLAMVYEFNKNYDSAITNYKTAINILEKINNLSPDYMAVVRNLATLYESVNDYINAATYYLTLVETKKKVYGVASDESIIAIDELVNVYVAGKKYDKAISQYQDLLNTDTLSLPSRPQLLAKLGAIYEQVDDTAKAEKNYLLAKDIAEKLNINGQAYQSAVKHLAGLYVKQNKLDDAERSYLQVVDIEKKLTGDTSEAYFDKLSDLASFYDDNEKKYAKAEPLYLLIADFRMRVKGKESTSYAAMLNRMALMYQADKQYKKAEELFKVVTEIYRKGVGDEHEYYAITLSNQASLYEALGNYEKAIALYIKAMNIQKKVFGEDHANYIKSLKAVSAIYALSTQYDKAEPLYIKLAAYNKMKYGERSGQYASSLNNLGLLYNNMGQYDKAESNYRAAKQLYEDLNGKCNDDCATIMFNLALMNKKKGAYETAENLFKELLPLRKKLFGEKNEAYLEVLKKLASLYQSTTQFDKAESTYLALLDIIAKNYGTETEAYVGVLLDLAMMYVASPMYNKAEALELRALQVRRKLFGESSTQYFQTVENLGNLYLLLTRFDKIDSLSRNWLVEVIKKYGEEHPEYARVLDQQAQWCQYMGLNDKAEQYFTKAASIYERILGAENPSYTTTLNNLAGLYVYIDQYAKAEVLYIKIAETIKHVWGERHPQYAAALSKLGDLYIQIGQKTKAESYWTKVLDINRQNNGEENLTTVLVMEKLANLYGNLGQDEKGMQLAKTALEITGRVLGKNNDTYAEMLRLVASFHVKRKQYKDAEPLLTEALAINDKSGARAFYAFTSAVLADLYLATKDYDKAEKWYRTSLDSWEAVFGKTHIGYALGLNSLSKVYKAKGDNVQAENLLKQTIEIWKASVGADNKGLAVYLRNLAFFYEDIGNYAKAEPLLEQVKDIEVKDLFTVFANLTEKEKGNFLEEKVTLNATFNSFLYAYPQAGNKFIRDNFNLQLLLKSLTLADTKNVMESVKNSKDTAIKQTYLNWQANKIILSKQYAMPVASRRADLQQIEEETESLEKKLALMSIGFRDQQKALQLKFTDVQKGMEEGEAAIEFVRFTTYRGKWTDSIMYAAYILKKNDSVPVFLPLCEERQLQQLFASAGRTTTAMVSSLYRGVGEDDKNVSIYKGDSLYKLVWQPLEPYLQGITKVSYSPVGKLHSIAFNALPAGDKVLMDKYELHQYASTRDIAFRHLHVATRPTNITLFGDPQFTMDSLELAVGSRSKTPVSGNIYVPSTRGNHNSSWGSLPGTAEEVKKIQQLFAKNKIATDMHTGAGASEENLKLLSGKAPHILHIATHGFFLPDNTKKQDTAGANTYSLANDPLLRSGLILSGGNYAWSGHAPLNGVEDGIATAYEISQIDLSKTELVVLSACETALGDVKGSEGVFGLQRAFKMAGANKLIVSLWQVPDKETAELMTLFYSDWLNGSTIESAFYKAQLEMRKKYTPFYWAAFVLVQ